MPKLKTQSFYYGAVIETIMRYNEDATPSLVEKSEHKQVYKIWTNTSKKEFYIYVKYRTDCKNNKKEKYNSWQFTLTDDDKSRIDHYIDTGIPVMLIWLCGKEGLKDSEILIINELEYEFIKDKNSVNVSLVSNERSFRLHVGGSRENAIQIPRNRIEQKFDNLIVGEAML